MKIFQHIQRQHPGKISTRTMFSGIGYFLDEVMFGIYIDGFFYVKANGEFARKLNRMGFCRYIYTKPRRIVTNYYMLSEKYIDDGELINEVINEAKLDFMFRIKRNKQSVKIRNLINMRLSTEILLRKIGILSLEDLKKTGSVEAYVSIKESLKLDVSERLLFRLEGALLNQHWMCIGEGNKQMLREQVVIHNS